MKQSKKIKQVKLNKFNDLKIDNTSSIVGGSGIATSMGVMT